MKTVIVCGLIALAVVHQDFWWWDDPTPVFGFIPVGLAWHILISILATVLWWLATKHCWPEHLEEESEPASDAGTGAR